MILSCPPRVKIVELFDYCVWNMLWKLTTLAFKVLSDLKRIEPNSTTLYDRRIEICASMGVLRFFSRGGQHRNFAYPFQVADDAVQMDVHKTLCPFYPISLRWLNLNSQSLSEMFSTLRLLEIIFLFIKTLISIK